MGGSSLSSATNRILFLFNFVTLVNHGLQQDCGLLLTPTTSIEKSIVDPLGISVWVTSIRLHTDVQNARLDAAFLAGIE